MKREIVILYIEDVDLNIKETGRKRRYDRHPLH